MTASLLPLPDDPHGEQLIQNWPWWWETFPHPRSVWLREFEEWLREFYPQANSRSLSLTARHHAPFYLRDGPNVP